MKPLRDHDIERLLASGDRPQPPTDLADRIKAEIPEVLPVQTETPQDESRATRHAAWRRVLPIAAMLIVAIGAGLLSLDLRRDTDPMTELRTAEPMQPVAEPTQPVAEPVAEPDVEPTSDAIESSPPATMAEPVTDAASTSNELEPVALSRDDTATSAPTSISPSPWTSTGAGADTPADPVKQADPAIGSNDLGRDTELAPEPRADGTIGGLRAVTEEPVTLEEVDTVAAQDESNISFRGGAPRTEDVVFGIPEAPPAPSTRAEGSLQGAPSATERAGVALRPDAQMERQRRVKTKTVPAPADAVSREHERRYLYDMAEPEPPPPPAPYDNVTFRDYGVNPWVDARADRESTFGLDVDTGSFNIVRRFLSDGRLPDPAAVRVEELVNAFDYGDRPPRRGDFAVHADMAPAPTGYDPNTHVLRFAVKAREVDSSARPSADLILVIDTSGSMNRENRLGLVKDAVTMLLGQLRSDDRVALVTFGSEARIALLPTRDHDAVRDCVRGLRAGGSTNAAHGLHLGYQIAADYRRRGAASRVMLLSDGVANVGATSASAMLDDVAKNRDAGVELTTVGVGMGNFNDVLLEQLADRGDGRYAYVDDHQEAHRLFVETLTGTLTTVAAEARVQVEFDPEVVRRYRLIGYENRAIADRDFRNDRIDAGEIGAGHTAVALYQVELYGDVDRLRPGHPLATLRLRHRSARDDEMVENAYKVTNRMRARRFDDASPALRLTALVAQAGEILRHSRYARRADLMNVFRETQRVSADFAGDARVADWVALLGRAARLGDQTSFED